MSSDAEMSIPSMEFRDGYGEWAQTEKGFNAMDNGAFTSSKCGWM